MGRPCITRISEATLFLLSVWSVGERDSGDYTDEAEDRHHRQRSGHGPSLSGDRCPVGVDGPVAGRGGGNGAEPPREQGGGNKGAGQNGGQYGQAVQAGSDQDVSSLGCWSGPSDRTCLSQR